LIRTLWQNEPTKKQLRQFLFIIGLAILAGLTWALIKGNSRITLLFSALLIFLFLGWLWQSLLIFFYRIWMSLSHLIGSLMSHIILTLIFFLIFTPIGLILRISGKRPLDLKLEKEKNSYWQSRKNRQSDLTKMY